MKPLFVSRHAFLRVRQREISLEDVKKVLQRPDLLVSAKHGRLKAIKRYSDRELVVIYKRARHMYIVVTAYWREKC